MRTTREQTEANRTRILTAAARLFRERGFEGVAVSDLMSAAGFTHGGFYNHFTSKEALAEEACAHAFRGANDGLEAALETGDRAAFGQYVEEYLAPRHRDDPGSGCTLGALAADARRQGGAVQARFAESVERVIAILAAYLEKTGVGAPDGGGGGGGGAKAARARAIQLWSEIIGALVLARAVASVDPTLSNEILASNRQKLLR